MGWYIEDLRSPCTPATDFMGKSEGWPTLEQAQKEMFDTAAEAIEAAAHYLSGPDAYKVVEYRPCLADSGARETSVTGGLREPSSGRGAYELLPPGPIERLAKHYENGAKKYASRNWEKGIETGRIMQSLLRHAFKYLGGSRDEDHLAAVAWNAFALMHHEDALLVKQLPRELDTLPCLRGDGL
jgi:hypothetical protein